MFRVIVDVQSQPIHHFHSEYYDDEDEQRSDEDDDTTQNICLLTLYRL